MKKLFIITMLGLTSYISFQGMENPMPRDPDLFVDIKNKTPKRHNLVVDKNATPIKVGQSVRLNLGKSWHLNGLINPAINAKAVTLYIKDTDGNTEAKTEFELLPISGALTVHLDGKNIHEGTSVSYEPTKTLGFVINIILKGDNLEETSIDSTASEK